MKKITAIMGALLIFASVGYAGNFSKAQDLIKAGMYTKAIALLEQEVRSNPANAEAYFELGACYLIQERYEDADARFASALRLNPDYKSKKVGVYRSAGLSAVDRGQVEEAITLLSKAITWQPDLKKEIIADLMTQGKAAAERKKFDQANARFAVAAEFDQAAGNEACGMYAGLGDAADDKNCVSFYQQAPSTCGTNEKIGARVLALAEQYARKPGKENTADEYRRAARRYLGDAVVDRKLPDILVLTPDGCYEKRPDRKCDKGTYRFAIAKGEKTPFWLTFPTGGTDRVEHLSTNSQYEIRYRDNSPPVKMWKYEQMPSKNHSEEMFIAAEDTLVIVKFKEMEH